MWLTIKIKSQQSRIFETNENVYQRRDSFVQQLGWNREPNQKIFSKEFAKQPWTSSTCSIFITRLVISSSGRNSSTRAKPEIMKEIHNQDTFDKVRKTHYFYARDLHFFRSRPNYRDFLSLETDVHSRLRYHTRSELIHLTMASRYFNA